MHYLTNTTVWRNFLTEIRNKVNENEVDAWVNHLNPIDMAENHFTIGGVNRFFCDWIRENRASLLKECLLKNYKKLGLKSTFVLNLKAENANPFKQFNPEYVFEKFINGDNSKIAYAAARSAAENIKTTKYNPLFICGSVGLGKTHLVQAIGNEVLVRNPGLNILYCTTEKFTNDYIEGIRFQTIETVRKKYRNLDMLIIDDIQFLEKKEGTQEEFFHTFNALIQRNCQVTITADRYPKEIKNIEERLISRFSAGMACKIEPPEFETRVAIIKHEISKSSLNLSEEVIEHIAHTIKTNVRDIKGILTILEAENSLLKQEVTLESARIILKDILNLDKTPIGIDKIIKIVSDKLNVRTQDILSEKRDRDISHARQIAMYISRVVTDMSYPVIAKNFDKNHASVIQACKRTNILMEENMEMKQMITSIIKEISI